VGGSLRGALRLALRDPSGIALLEQSADGFWRSFLAAALALPLYLPFSVAEGAAAGTGLGRHVAWELVGYALVWTGWPLALLALARVFGRVPRYGLMVVASNWVRVPEYALLAAAHLGALALPPLALPLVLTAFAVVLSIEYFLARAVLDLAPLPAAAVVAAMVALVVAIDRATTPLA